MMDMSTPEIRRFYAQAGTLEPTDLEIAQVLQRVRATARRRRPTRRLVVAVALVVAALCTAAFAYPATLDALDNFFAGGATPGSPALGSLPAWLESSANPPAAHATRGSERLLAEQDGQTLYAYRDAGSGRACLVFANDSDTCSDSGEWHQLFANHALLKMASGVGPTGDGKVAVFGLARTSVIRVELRDGSDIVYSTPVTNGGWVIVAPQGQHDSLLGLDRNGNVIETLDPRDWTWTFCLRESGCP
jgi:hypothetical protein